MTGKLDNSQVQLEVPVALIRWCQRARVRLRNTNKRTNIISARSDVLVYGIRLTALMDTIINTSKKVDAQPKWRSLLRVEFLRIEF